MTPTNRNQAKPCTDMKLQNLAELLINAVCRTALHYRTDSGNARSECRKWRGYGDRSKQPALEELNMAYKDGFSRTKRWDSTQAGDRPSYRR